MNRFFFLLLLLFIFSGCTATRAQSSYSTRKNTHPKALALYNKANALAGRKEYDKAIAYYQKALKKDPQFVDPLLKIGAVFYEMKNYPKAIDYFRRARRLAPDYKPATLMALAEAYAKNKQFGLAAQACEKYLSHPKARERRKEICKKKIAGYRFAQKAVRHPLPFAPKNLGPAINTQWPEYLPSFTADGEVFIFTRRVNGQEDFYVAHKKDGHFTKAEPLRAINTPKNEGAQCISPDGRFLALTKCGYNPTAYGSCDIYWAQKNNGTWSKIKNIGPPVNTRYWEAQPSLSANGRELYFASERPGGKGKRDIWVSYRQENGHWSRPVNLGDSINTAGNDQAPFIHPDGRTLYFMSDGWPGMGGADLFMSKRKKDGTWSTPVNLGYPLNTEGNQGALVISTDGTKGYFAGPKATAQPGDFFGGSIDIFEFDVPTAIRPEPVTYVKGKVIQANIPGTVIPGAHVELVDLNNGQSLLSTVTDRNGTFLAVLPQGRYALHVKKEGFLFFSANYELNSEKSLKKPYALTAALYPLSPKTTREKPAVTILRNVFFDSGSATLKPESHFELDELVRLLKENPALNIQINGHTDNIGSEADNQYLSTQRAKAVYEYLIQNGIPPNRLKYKGFGESQPIATNDTEEGRKQNRRTEIQTF